jgi:hypothetical protein
MSQPQSPQGCGAAELGYGVWGLGSGIGDRGSGIRDEGSGRTAPPWNYRHVGAPTYDQGSGVRGQGSGIRDQGRRVGAQGNAMEPMPTAVRRNARLSKDAVQRARALRRPSPRRLHGFAAASSHEDVRGPGRTWLLGIGNW